MSLLLLGDAALPFFKAVKIDIEEEFFKNKTCVANLESAIDPVGLRVRDELKYNLYSSLSFLSLAKQINLKVVSLANNHAGDFVNGAARSTSLLERNKIDWFGLANKPYTEITVGAKKCFIMGSCSPITDCKKCRDFSPAIHKPGRLLQTIRHLRENSPEADIIVFVHWGYELAKYPQPADRKWARQAITSGATAVIGHHPHVIQGVELYKKGIIAYSLGNWMLPQVKYRGRLLSYKAKEAENQLGIEWVGADDSTEWIAHLFHYDKRQHRISLEKSVEVGCSDELEKLTPYRGYSDDEYRVFFKSLKAEEGTPAGYPTLWSYSNNVLNASMLKYGYIRFRKYIRRLAIVFGIHKPYNWG